MAQARAPQDNFTAMEAFFRPKNVAIVGATEKQGSVGRTLIWNLISSPFGGTVFPVNLKRPSVLGIKAYPTLQDISEALDLVVICTPAPTVPAVISEAVDLGIPAAVVISAGFKEIGPEGAALEQQILAEARRGQMRIIGPNCLGVMSPLSGLNATFAKGIANPGSVGFISQSGALCTAVLDWSFRENVGFSAFVSIGSMLDVGWGDLIDYLGNDPRTKSIVIYMESIGDARAFLSAAREVALTKPIIVIKAGRTAAAAQAAASHTGSLTGSDEVLDAAFQRSGVLRVDSIGDLFSMAETLAKQPRPAGPRLTILTNAGGPGVLATDALISSGGELAPLSEKTMGELNGLLPHAWSHNNPVDILGDADPERYAKALEIAGSDPNSDGLLVILTPQDMTSPTPTAELLKPYAQIEGKPVLASWMGGGEIAAGEEILNRAGIPTFEYPDMAAQVFSYMWQYSYNLRALYETPALPREGDVDAPNRALVTQIISDARQAGRAILTEYESKQIFAAYGIPTNITRLALSEPEAVRAAEAIGFPVVLKLHSHTVTHKTDVGGVQLNLGSSHEVRAAYYRIKEGVEKHTGGGGFDGVTVQPMEKLDGYELIVGSSPDPQFGPVLLFGTGGTMVEVYKDRALGLPPLNTTLARRMIEQTRIFEALKGIRGRAPVDVAALEQLLVRFSQLVVEQPWIKEIDVNPLLASPRRIVALDARVLLYDPETPAAKLPKLAIRPYPVQYESEWTDKKGEKLTFRPIRPEDEPLVVKFHESLSEQSVLLRYMYPMKLRDRISHERLSRICYIDYDREMALVVEASNGGSQRTIAGIGRLRRITARDANFELTMLVSDAYQGRGIGTELMHRLIDIARKEGNKCIVANIGPENAHMIHVVEQLGFDMSEKTAEGVIRARLSL